MATTTTKLGLRKPDPDPSTGDVINVVTDINDSMDKLDGATGIFVCTSGTRPTGAQRWDGREIHETDTRRNYMWSAAVTNWLPLFIGRGTNGPYLLGTSIDLAGEGINNATTGSGVTTWRTRVSGDANPRFTIDTSGRMDWGGAAGATDVILSRTAANVLGTGTGDALQVSGDYVCGSEQGISGQAVTSGTNTQPNNTYANLAGTGAVTSFSFVKRFTATRVRLDISATFYTSVATCGARFAALVNGVDYDVCQLAGNVPNSSVHLPASGFAYIPAGLAAGTYTVQGRWKTIVAAGTLTRDNNDWFSMSARECN